MRGGTFVVAGAGVIGLAVGQALAAAGREVLIVETADRIGSGISARNSEVIHAGLYYPPGSLKARLCVEGRRRLYAYCRANGVAHRQLGKLIAAAGPAQVARLEAIRANAGQCGVDDLVMLDRGQARTLEPALECAAAILSPSTGIVDAPALMLALQGQAEAAGAGVVLRTAVERVSRSGEGFTVHTRDASGAAFALEAAAFVNAAGLAAPALAAAVEGLPAGCIPRGGLARGCYFTLPGRSPFSRLIYPVPVDGGLGVHLTLDLAGQARFGPDVEWIDTIDYRVDPARAALFEAEIRRYWPGLPSGALQPGYAGIRPKLSGPGERPADFLIQGPADHGAGPLVNLFGIESPGLTSSLAIAAHVAALLADV